MKYKIMIILLTAIFFVSIAGVCATDANDTALDSVDEQATVTTTEEIESGDSQILELSNGNEILKEKSITVTNHTFEDIERAIDNGYDTIYLEPGTYKGTNSIGIMQMENVKIIGNSTILDGQGMTEIVFIQNSANIMMQNITFVNGIFDDGGAITATYCSNVQIIDCTFTNNTASQLGGAIMFTLVDVDVINSTFTNNKAINDGGAIGWIGGDVKIEGCIFTNNTAEGSSIVCGQAATADITNSIFTDNRAGSIVYGWAGNYMTVNNNIFINNNGTAIDFEDPDSNVDYNWFGNNQSNYKDDPGIKGCSKWLFLNATVNSTEISIGQNSIIAFKLDSYNNDTGHNYPYDASKLKFVLDLTQTLGELDKTTALIGENIIYTAKQGGTARITGKYETASYTIELNNVKLPTEINITNSTIALKVNEETGAGATLTPADAGNLTYTSSNSSVVTVDEKGLIRAIGIGNAIITVSFAGNSEYTAAVNKTIDVTVSLNDASVRVNNETLDLLVGDVFSIVAVTSPAGLNVTYVADDSGVVSIDENGVCTALREGTGSILVIVGGDGVYAENSTEILVSVSKIPTNISAAGAFDLKVLDEVDAGADLTPAAAGNLTYASTNSSVVIVEDGKIKALGEGTATITISFAGDDIYAAAESKNITVTVSLNDASVSVNDETLVYLFVDDDFSIVAVTSPSGLNVTYVADDSGVVSIDENGVGTALKEGTGSILVKVGGDGVYAENSTVVTFTVSKISTEITIDSDSLDLFVGDETVIVAALTSDDTGNVTFTSSNESVVEVDAEGNVIAQGKGQAIITVSFAGNNKYAAAENRTITVTVSLNDANVTVDNDTLDLKVGETYAINATKHPDTILLDITYTSSNSSVATVNEKGIVTAVGEGTAVITVEVGDDEIYAKNSTNVTVTVSKVSTEIAAKSITTTYNVNKYLVITLKDANGNALSGVNVNVNLNGAKTLATDKNGQVKVSTKGLAPKTYAAKITFAGNNKYNGSSADVKVTVNKATPKLTAKKKTFKAKIKTKKYTVTLKDNKGKPIKKAKITLKVKGKTYKATTNSKGKATFKIKKLNKKGTFKATVTYKGNKYYKKVTKKAKIKVIVTFKTVSKGSKDKATVKEIQQALKNKGYYLTYDGHYLKIDGIYHGCTEKSVKEFQHDKGLKVTGKVDEKTAKKLGLI